jgi:RNA polymerase sigma factor (sigma-70 family)
MTATPRQDQGPRRLGPTENTAETALPSDFASSRATDSSVREAHRADRGVMQPPAGWEADRLMTELYAGEYRSLVRLAILLVHDLHTAEEVVQDAFVAVQAGWWRLRDSDKALSYVRQTVVNRSHSVLRRRAVADRSPPKPPPGMPSAEQQALAHIDGATAAKAVLSLSSRQQQVFVLYANGYSAVEIAQVVDISVGAVRSHVHLARKKLRELLRDLDIKD